MSTLDLSNIHLRDTITIDWDLYSMATFNATIVEAQSLRGFDDIEINREEVEIFGGRIVKSQPVFSSDGRAMRMSGFDHTHRLLDYKTPIQSVTDVTTAVMLGTILLETPFTISTSGTFQYITELTDWDTFIEMATDIEVFSDVTIELDIDETEVSDLVNAGTWTGCSNGLKSTFFYDGTTQRFYVFVKDAGNNLYYYHSTDGDTWTGVDTTYNPSGDRWTVAWYADKVYLFFYDGANTDFYRGTITDATGVITFALIKDNAFAATTLFGPVFDDSDHVWVIGNVAGGTAYESTDDGATWAPRFAGVNELWAILPTGSDGDMYGFVLDTVNNDVEEWLWDRSAGTFTFQNKITNENDIDVADACSDADWNPYFAWEDGGDTYLASNKSGAWTTAAVFTSAPNNLTMGSDGYYVYIGEVGAFGYRVWKYEDTTEHQDSGSLTTYVTPTYISCPRGYMQDGQIAIFFSIIHSTDDDPYFHAFSQMGLRLVEAATTGYIRTETVTASGSFVRWGLCTASGNDDLDETSWDILKSADNSILAQDQLANFDMHAAGVPITETTIKVYIEFDGTDENPLVYEFSVTERTDNVSMDTDGEDCYTAVTKLANLAGAEFYILQNDDDTYTFYFTTRRGEDKSYIILKTATTGDELDTKPNIKMLLPTYDWTDFANCVLFIGGLDANDNRVEVEVRDTTSIIERDQEFWVTIRDAEVTSNAMGRTRAVLELEARNAVIIRMRGEFIDKTSSNDITIGDSVVLICEWDDVDLKIEGLHRIVRLTRNWGSSGENVTAEFSNRLKPAQYYNYLKKVDDLERVSTL